MKRSIILFALVFAITTLCSAEVIVIDADATVAYDHRGIGGISGGILGRGYFDFNSGLIFSIPDLSYEITEVKLVLELTGYFSDDPSEDIRISAVDTPVNELTASHFGLDAAPWIYNDLMEGPELGTMTVNLGTLRPFTGLDQWWNDGKGPLFSCQLNETGLQSVNDAKGETFAIGLNMMNIDDSEEECLVFQEEMGDPDYWVAQLQITTVPEPGTLLLLVAGTIFLRKKQ